MTEPIDLGPRLEPPRGGWSRLQQSVNRSRSRDPGRLAWLAAAASLAAAAVIVSGRGIMQSRGFELAIRTAMTAAQETRFDGAAYQVLPSHGRNVRIFLIGALPARLPCDRAPADRMRPKSAACPPLPG